MAKDIPLRNLIVITARNDQLNESILARSRAIGTGLGQEYKTQMGLLIRDVVQITPPSSGANVVGRKAELLGQGAIGRDLGLMGFTPVKIKHYRMISHVPAGNVKGRAAVPISPVRVRTVENPRFADPDSFHRDRLRRKSGAGRRAVSRGGAQAFYVSIPKYRAMKTRLFKEIGKLAAPWLPAIRMLFNGALPGWVPLFIRRHEGDVAGRTRFNMNFNPEAGTFYIHVVNSMPASADAEAAETQRRIETAKLYRIGAIRRGLQGMAQRLARQGR